jgi:hypothetical protein
MNRAVLVVVLASSVSWAQTPDMPNRVRGLLGQSATASSAPAPLSQPAAPAASASNSVKQAELISTGPAKIEPTPRKSYSGKRDPFLSEVVERSSSVPENCAGKRCLVIDQVVLRGIVRTANGMIAVVANTANKAYFLKEKDPVFNGMVMKITGDSVVFKERTIDNVGHVGSREVVKRVSPTPSA